MKPTCLLMAAQWQGAMGGMRTRRPFRSHPSHLTVTVHLLFTKHTDPGREDYLTDFAKELT